MSGAESASIGDRLRPLQAKDLTLREVAERLGKTHQTVSRHARAKDLHGARQVGPHWRVHADVFEAWLNCWWDPDVETWSEFAARNDLTETRYL